MIQLPDESLGVVMILRAISTNCHVVGGFVRDHLLGETSKDLDFVTDAPYDTMADAFKTAGWKVKETGKQFLVLMITKDGRSYEIANYRKDGVYLDGRRPESCEIGNIYEDAMRRDFTINALYLNLNTMEIEDPLGTGLWDLRNRKLRFIGSAQKRIEEDYLRVFRFYRFLETKSLYADSASLKMVRKMFPGAIKHTHPERVRNELERMINKERM